MEKCSMLTSVLVAVIVAVVSGHAEEKLFTCCEKVSTREITEPIIKFKISVPNPPCVKAVIFTTENGHYCSYIRAPWVSRKIKELMRAKAQSSPTPVVTSSPPSSFSSFLLSLITSTASPSSSSTTLPSSSSSSSSSSSFFSSTSPIAPSETLSGTTDQ